MATINHYQFLGLPSPAEQRSQLTLREIEKAYRIKARELHPDKRPNDPHAHSNFQKLQFSYNFLRDEKSRKALDDALLRSSFELQRRSRYDFKRRKMMSDLEQRESAAASSSVSKAEEEEERIVKKFRQEIESIRSLKKNNLKDEENEILEVSWEGNVDDYSKEMLKELFSDFGEVQYVVPPPSRRGSNKRLRRWRALVVMATKDGAVCAVESVCGHLSFPLHVRSLSKVTPPPANVQHPDAPIVDEASILEKLRKAAEKQTERA